MVVLVTGGQAHEAPPLPALMATGAVKRPGHDGRPGRGRPRLRPDRVAGDKGYSYPSIRRYLRCRGISTVIPTKSDQRRNPRFDKQAYRQRNRVERCIGRLKRFRRVATRYEKRAVNYLAMVTIAAIMDWL
jgi:transposase